MIIRSVAATACSFLLCATAAAIGGLDPLAPYNDGQSEDDLWRCSLQDSAECDVCKLMRVIDGDTFEMWCGKRKAIVTVRLHGVDAPEIRGKERCPEEGKLGYEAWLFADNWLRKTGDSRLIVFVSGKDRNGRVVGMVTLRGRDLGADLVMRGLAKPWMGREAKPTWCP